MSKHSLKSAAGLGIAYAAGGAVLACAGGLVLAQPSGNGWIYDPRSGCATSNPFPKDGESIAWFGACRDGKLDGAGLLIWYRNGFENERDEGYFAGGELNGPATITFADGSSIRGDYQMGERNGEFLVHQRDGTTLYRVYRAGKLADERAASAEDIARLQARPTNAIAAASQPQPRAPEPPPVALLPDTLPAPASALPPAPPVYAPPPPQPSLAALPPVPPPPSLPAPSSRSAAANGVARSEVDVDLNVLANLRPGGGAPRASAPVKLKAPRGTQSARATTQASAARPAVFVDNGVIDGLNTRNLAYRPQQLAAVQPRPPAPVQAPIVPEWYQPAALAPVYTPPVYTPPAYVPPPYTPAAAPTGAVTPETLFAEGYRHEREGRLREAETMYDTVYRLFAGTPMATMSGERLAWVRQQTSGLPMTPQPTMIASASGTYPVPAPPASVPPMAPATAQFAPMPIQPPIAPVRPAPVAVVAQPPRTGAYLCTVDGLYSNNSRWCGVVRREYDRYYEIEVSKVTIKTPLAVGFNSSACTGNKFIGYFSFGERVWVPQTCMAETP